MMSTLLLPRSRASGAAELLDQQHDVIQQLEEQQHSLQVMSLTCSSAID